MPQVTMSAETVEQTLRFILGSRQGDRVDLSWFGGEPLLCPDIIDRICGGLRQGGLAYTSSMTSNGSLVTPEVTEKMVGDWNLSGIQISMDAAEEDYIARRRYHHYQDEYHKVMENISALSEAGIRVTVRCNVDEGNWENASQYLEDMKDGVESKEGVSLYFAPLNQAKRGEGIISLCEKIEESRKEIAGAGFGSPSQLTYAEHFRINHCMADSASVVITPDGGLYPCEHCPSEGRFGDIWNGVTDEGVRREFCRVDRTREKCRACPFLPNCTSFAACPIEVGFCREIQEMLTLDMLKGWIDGGWGSESADDGISIC